MKTTKRILVLLLTLALGRALFAPTAAAEADPMAPVITKDLERKTHTADSRISMTLEVAAGLPENSQGTLRYQWYVSKYAFTGQGPGAWSQGKFETEKIEGADSPKLKVEFSLDDLDRSRMQAFHRYYVEICHTYMDGGVEKTAATRSAAASFSCYASFFDGYRLLFSNMAESLKTDGILTVLLAPIVFLGQPFIFFDTRSKALTLAILLQN
jgi:hypothetical protein